MKRTAIVTTGLLVSCLLAVAQSNQGSGTQGSSGSSGSGSQETGSQGTGTQQAGDQVTGSQGADGQSSGVQGSGNDEANQGPAGGGDKTGGSRYEWSNSTAHSNAVGAVWGKQGSQTAEIPQTWSRKYSHSYAGQSQAGGGGQVQNRFGKTELPADVQDIIKQFQRDRTRLMSQLKTCSDQQRQEMLKEMEQLRTQLRQQVSRMRDQARDQAEQMRHRFGNNRDRLLSEGANAQGTGRDR